MFCKGRSLFGESFCSCRCPASSETHKGLPSNIACDVCEGELSDRDRRTTVSATKTSLEPCMEVMSCLIEICCLQLDIVRRVYLDCRVAEMSRV